LSDAYRSVTIVALLGLKCPYVFLVFIRLFFDHIETDENKGFVYEFGKFVLRYTLGTDPRFCETEGVGRLAGVTTFPLAPKSRNLVI